MAIQLTRTDDSGSEIWLWFDLDGVEVVAMAYYVIHENTARLTDFHIDGPGPNVIGRAGINAMAALAKGYFGVTTLEIEGYRRTTGANPGHKPRLIIL